MASECCETKGGPGSNDLQLSLEQLRNNCLPACMGSLAALTCGG